MPSVEAVHLDQLGPAYLVFGLGRELGVAAVVEVERDNLGQAVATDIEPFALAQTLEEVELLIVQS